MTTIDCRARLRDMLQGPRCVAAGSVFDPLSARIADELGIPAGVLGGSVASMAVLGAPDLILLTLTELAEQVRRICRAAPVSLLVDADHGYGNALNVMRTVQELESAGAAGLSIEDTLLPRSHGSGKAAELISLEEGVGKMRAAVQARRDAGLVIAGRTSAVTLLGVEEGIRRLRAYAQAGVDALFIPGLKRKDDLDRLADALGLPLILGSPGPELLGDPAFMESRGVRLYFAGHEPYAAAVRALYEAMAAAMPGQARPDNAVQADAGLLARLTRSADYERDSQAFLGPRAI